MRDRRSPSPACRLGLLIAALLCLMGTADAEILRTAWIPNRWMSQGQVHVVREGGVVNVHVLLHTRFLDRVVSAIAEKESAHWPEDHPDTAAYIATLHLARADLKAQTRGYRQEALKIAFRLGVDEQRIVWSTGTMTTGPDDRWVLQHAYPLRTLTPGHDYLVRNAALILADNFAITLEDAQRWLAGNVDVP